jgi:predicted SAM-dependent methyltransferase
MATDAQFEGWNWEDTDALAGRMEEFSANIAQCEKLELLSPTLPRSRSDFAALGLSGIEFAAFKTLHPEGLGTDLAGLRGPEGTTEPGNLYLVDGASRFTQLDIAEPLPFEDGAVDWVYAEHLIEHVPLPVAMSWLAEVRRVLAPGGLLRLSTPDLRRYVEGYLEEDRPGAKGGFFAKHRRRLQIMRVGPAMPPRRAFMFNQLFYLYGHRWIFDEQELRHTLTTAGFDPAGIAVRTFQEGARADVAGLDVSFRSDETIYIEAAA